ncbi:hypothetical protein EV426DRAFT_570658 [Tirmania nivea]|nr:hypothetical protein EV426DRAFT_570658 [Tirmania nivea]
MLCGAELCGAELCGAELCGAELCGAGGGCRLGSVLVRVCVYRLDWWCFWFAGVCRVLIGLLSSSHACVAIISIAVVLIFVTLSGLAGRTVTGLWVFGNRYADPS